MCGLSAVTSPMEFSTLARSRSVLAVMPSTQRSASVRQARSRWVTDSDRECRMIGSKALSWSCPASAAMVMATSLPMTSKATWLTTSGMTGLTLPGMIDEPACTGGRLISPSPARGPEDSSRRSLQLLESLTAIRLSTPDICTKAPQSWVASTRLAAVTSGSPVIADRCRRAASAYPDGALIPVPIAVAPRLISWISSTASASRLRSSSIITANAENS